MPWVSSMRRFGAIQWSDSRLIGRGLGGRQVMAAVADAVVVFWDGRSPGTGHMVDIARSRGLPLRVVRF